MKLKLMVRDYGWVLAIEGFILGAVALAIVVIVARTPIEQTRTLPPASPAEVKPSTIACSGVRVVVRTTIDGARHYQTGDFGGYTVSWTDGRGIEDKVVVSAAGLDIKVDADQKTIDCLKSRAEEIPFQ